MNNHVSAARALASEFAVSVITPIAFIVGGVVLVGILLAWALAAFFSVWWWLLAIPFVVIGAFATGALLISWLIIRTIRPNLTVEQREAVKDFVEKAQGLSEVARTPYPFLVARIVFDLILYRDGRYVRSLIADSKSLKSEYQAIKAYF